jgi:two-component system, cell cycle sensor histidine kinase PleC
MRSTESSGAESRSFAPRPAAWLGGIRHLIDRAVRSLSPVTLAVAATAFAGFGFFVAVDLSRTNLETPRSIRAAWISPVPTGGGLLGVLQRGAGALGVALLATGIAWRRSEKSIPAARLDALLGTLPFGAACWGPDARLVACNARFLERTGTGPLPPGSAYRVVARAIADGGSLNPMLEDNQNRLFELRRPSGETLLIEEKPLADGGFVTLVMDITESRRTTLLLTTIREEQRQLARRYHEEKLRAEAASHAKTSFLAHLSHDIRTPLNHIIGFADMIRQQPYGPLGDARYLNYVEAVKGSGERLLSFFGSILEFAELEGGRRALQRDRFTADELMLTVLKRFSPQAQRAGLTLGLGGACEAQLLADRFALERMIANLVENAIRFTPRGGRVTLAAYAAPDGVVLEITDTGIGMPQDRLTALSQPFAFSDAALTREREGAGLGLQIARAIAELSGGHLAIDSRLGIGTTVAVSLPLGAAEEGARAA